MTTLICLPAHILDANISPRAREVLMLLASQTSAAEPALWICQATIAERLRCSVATVARSIQKLIEAKLIAETGKLHQGRYKFYHVRWSVSESLRAAEKKIKAPVRKIANEAIIASATKQARLSEQPREDPPTPFRVPPEVFKGGQSTEAAPVPTSTLSPASMRANDRIAYYAEIARKQYEENRRKYRAMLLELR